MNLKWLPADDVQRAEVKRLDALFARKAALVAEIARLQAELAGLDRGVVLPSWAHQATRMLPAWELAAKSGDQVYAAKDGWPKYTKNGCLYWFGSNYYVVGSRYTRDGDRLVVRNDVYKPISGFEVAETTATLRALVARLRGEG